MAARRLPAGIPTWVAYWVLPLFFALAAAGMLRILSRTIYLADDTINHYAHVWYISDQLYGSGTIPLRFTELDGGRAFTYPYAIAPWTLNALIYPLFGDWSVTLFLVLGGLAAIAGALLVRPSMRDPWLLVLFVFNPFFIDALANGQYAFLWSAAGFFAFVWAAERRSWIVATVACVFTVTTHPIEGGLASAAFILYSMITRPDRRAPLALVSLVTVPFIAPSFYFAWNTPAVDENSWRTIIGSILNDLPRRGTVLAAPFALSAAAPFLRAHYRPVGAAFAGVTAALVVLASGAGVDVPGLDRLANPGGYAGLVSAADNDYHAYITSGDFASGKVYRVLSPNEREQGALFLMRHHAVLANDLFSESQHRTSWSPERYRCYLAAKHVDRVVIEQSYGSEFKTNEQALLDGLVANGDARVTYGAPGARLEVYDVAAFRDSAPAPRSVRECRSL